MHATELVLLWFSSVSSLEEETFREMLCVLVAWSQGRGGNLKREDAKSEENGGPQASKRLKMKWRTSEGSAEVAHLSVNFITLVTCPTCKGWISCITASKKQLNAILAYYLEAEGRV